MKDTIMKKYKSIIINDIKSQFIDSCEQGNLEIIKSLFLTKLLTDKIKFDGFVKACEFGKLNIIEFIHNNNNNNLFKKFLSLSNIFNEAENKETVGFLMACNNNDLNLTKYLLNRKEIIKNKNFKTIVNDGLLSASGANNLEVVEFLFSNFNIDPYHSFLIACANGNVSVVDYFLKNAKNNQINLFDGFFCSVEEDNQELIKYFIFDYGIKKNEDITKSIRNKQEIINMFNLRDINNSLDENLSIKNKNLNKKIKI